MKKQTSLGHDIVVITIITLIAGLLLGLIHSITAGPIAEQEEKTRIETQKAVFQSAASFEAIEGIKEDEAKHHPDKNIITRAIGAKEDVEMDFFEYRVMPGDLILMCTDGLSNMVEDEDIFRIIRGSRDLPEAVQNLIDQANENGGKDNIGIVLADPNVSEEKNL